MKCVACNKEITSGGKLISIDGDFTCDDECYKAFHREMGVICKMNDKQFEDWMNHGIKGNPYKSDA